MTWAGQAAIVTGASGGIGEEIAVQLATAGARVTLAARRPDELERVATRCRSASGRTDDAILVVPCDVTDRTQCESLVASAVAAFGGIDVLVNNAGQGMWGRADEVSDLSIYEAMLRVNYLSAVWLTLAALPHLKTSRGRVLAVGSLSGKIGVPLRSGYAAAKHALTGFMDSLRIELDGTGVSVTMIHPGFVTTGSQARNLGTDGRALGAMPLKVSGGQTPDECAAMLLAGAALRKRDIVPGFRARLGLWLKLLAPTVVDNMASKAIRGRQ
ncbi:MAG: SDR family oxidoreductase [Gemmatimonadetes bacterium]|nr:SDR family oxidoreductase [Gemmatimonadota bacterium]